MKLTKSFEYLERAEKVIPVCSQVFSKAPSYFPRGVSPVYLEQGWGSHVWDVDGNKYIDFICGLGPITLGYRYPKVDRAIMEQLLNHGITYSLPHPLEVQLSELLIEIIPCAEMVRFLKTGSEACQAAVRAARAYTGRMGIAYRGYHGWHEWYAVTTERPKGISKSYQKFMFEFEYNNIESLERIFNREGIAAVIMEPVIVNPPKDNFLQKVRDLCTKHGAVLIFDEVVTGFRMALGGAQEYFGVTPDLTTFGKGIANGMPLSVVCGKKEIMREFEDIFVSSTFGGECLSLAAGLATIQEMRDKDTIGYIWNLGKELMNGLDNLGLKPIGYPCRPFYQLPNNSPEMTSLFVQEMHRKGILIHSGPALNLCYSHTQEDIDKTLSAIERTLEDIRTDKVKLEGGIVQPAFRRL